MPIQTEPNTIIKRVFYKPHSDLSIEIHRSQARFRILNCGRRFGKSTIEVFEAFRMSMAVRQKHNRSARGWIVAPTFDLAMEEWRIAEEMFKEVINPEKTSRHEKRIVLYEGSEIEFKSADNKDTTLRGAGLDWAILAEAARITREAWEQGVRPALSDRQGRAIFGSTPKGRNWFWEIYLQGQEQNQSEYKSWKLPTNSRPSFPKEEWEMLRRTLPELVFKQEFEAEFLEDASTIFRGISNCVAGGFEEPIPGTRYVVGVDLARLTDFTVIVVFDTQKKHLVAFDRFNQMSWPYQKEMIRSKAKKYNDAEVWLDSTGIGDPIEHDLRRMGVRCVGYKFTQTSKEELIELGALAVEQQMVTFPDIPELINELKSLEVEILASGKMRYAAPSGLHDDCVMAFCLALMGMKQQLYARPVAKDIKPYDHLDERSKAFWERWENEKKQDSEGYKVHEVLEGV